MREKIIRTRVIPRSKRNSIEIFGEDLKVHLTAPAEDGKANRLLVELVAEHFGVRRSQVSIAAGVKSRNKLIRIQEK